MPRQFRAKLPNGVFVSIEPFSERDERSRMDLVAEAERLAASLDSGEPFPDLIKFLANTGTTVFQEASLASQPTILYGPESFGADLMFTMRRQDGVGLVKVAWIPERWARRSRGHAAARSPCNLPRFQKGRIRPQAQRYEILPSSRPTRPTSGQ
jgi:hypothetical protein